MARFGSSTGGGDCNTGFGAGYSIDSLSIRTPYGKMTIPVLVVERQIKLNKSRNRN